MAQKEDKTRGQRFSEVFRQTAGLPERKTDEPITNDGGEGEGARLRVEPEGGYGGEGGIRNTGAINASEERLHLEVTEAAVPEADEAHALDPESHHLPETEKPSTAPQVRDAGQSESPAQTKSSRSKKD